MQNLTAQHYLYTLHSYPPCAVQIHLVWGGGGGVIFFFLFGSSKSLAPEMKGSWRVKGDHGQPRDRRRTWRSLLAASSLCHFWTKLTLIIKLTAHIKTAICCSFSTFAVYMPSSVFRQFDANWQYFGVPFLFPGRLPHCRKYAQLLTSYQPTSEFFFFFFLTLLWLFGLTGPKGSLMSYNIIMSIKTLVVFVNVAKWSGRGHLQFSFPPSKCLSTPLHSCVIAKKWYQYIVSCACLSICDYPA